MFFKTTSGTQATGEFQFDLEKSAKDFKSFQELSKKVQGLLQEIESLQRSGGTKEELAALTLLHDGYKSLMAVLERAKK